MTLTELYNINSNEPKLSLVSSKTVINLLDWLLVRMNVSDWFGLMQVFDNTPAAKDGTLESGDELVGVNGQSVKGKTKVEVAKMIQSCKV